MRATSSLIAIATALGLAVANPVGAAAQDESVSPSSVLMAFLADSGARTRGLAWTTGNDIPIAWATDAPVAVEDAWERKQGMTHTRTGTVTITVGEESKEAKVVVFGIDGGVQRVQVWVQNLDSTIRHAMLESLTGDGFDLQPLKCKMESEGEMFGNVVFIAKAPGKTASGLHASWNCAHDGCSTGLSILYRRADVNQVECSSQG